MDVHKGNHISHTSNNVLWKNHILIKSENWQPKRHFSSLKLCSRQKMSGTGQRSLCSSDSRANVTCCRSATCFSHSGGSALSSLAWFGAWKTANGLERRLVQHNITDEDMNKWEETKDARINSNQLTTTNPCMKEATSLPEAPKGRTSLGPRQISRRRLARGRTVRVGWRWQRHRTHWKPIRL